MKVNGLNNILNLFQNKLDITWRRLEKKYSNIKGEILFTLLLMINYYSRRVVIDGEFNRDDYLRIPTILLTLDEFLKRGWNIIKETEPEENQKYTDIILKEYQLIATLRNRMVLCEASNVEVIELKKGVKVLDAPIQIESAFSDWAAATKYDVDWVEYYHRKTTILPKLTEIFRAEFLRKHGIVPLQLYAFEKYLEDQAQNELTNDGIPFLHHNPADLLEKAHKIMNAIEPIGIIEVDAFLSKLEYNYDKRWAQSPFLKVQLDQSYLYALLLPSIYSMKFLTGAWINDTTRGTRTEGMRNRDYGRHFEEYVRELIRKYNPNLTVNKGNLRIKATKFPEIRSCTKSPEISIDVVAISGTHVYLLSCKAIEQNVGPRDLLTFFQQEYRTFYDSVLWDLDKSWEISDWVECISKSLSVLQDRDFLGKTIVPFLVTPDQRPLSLKSVQQWCIDEKLVSKLPNAKIISANELKDFLFI